MKFDERRLRDAFGAYPTGVAVVTADTEAGELIGVTVGSFTSVSLDPALVSFSLAKRLFSAGRLLEASRFAINVLGEDQEHVSRTFSRGGPDKWADIEPVRGRTGCPIIEGSLAAFECAHYAHYDGGDHVIILGRVLDFDVTLCSGPLLFFQGKYHGLQGQV